MVRLRALLGTLIGAAGALVSSLCCVLPVAIVILGLGSGAFMATTMKYTPVFLPIGIISLAAGFYLHFRERKRCARDGCRMVGGALNLALLVLSAAVVVVAVFFTLFPATSSELLMWATSRQGDAATHTVDMPLGSAR